MGDRNIIGFASDAQSAPVYLYSHWGGSMRYHDLADAIAKAEPRWCDPQYATRIAICSIIGEKNWAAETGFGITNDYNECDSNYDDMLVVCWKERRVEMRVLRSSNVAFAFSFEEFLSRFGGSVTLLRALSLAEEDI